MQWCPTILENKQDGNISKIDHRNGTKRFSNNKELSTYIVLKVYINIIQEENFNCLTGSRSDRIMHQGCPILLQQQTETDKQDVKAINRLKKFIKIRPSSFF